MSEALTEDRRDFWSDPAKLRFLREVIVDHVYLHRQIDRFKNGDGRVSMRAVTSRSDVSAWLNAREVKRVLDRQMHGMAKRFTDRYLSSGVDTLARESNWENVGDYLLTPEQERRPIERGQWYDVFGTTGAVCLAARFSGQSVMVNYNGIVLESRPDTRPQDVYAGWLEAVQERQEEARVSYFQDVV